VKLTKRKKLLLGGIASLAVIATIIFSLPKTDLNFSTSAVLAGKSATESPLSKPITIEDSNIKYGFVFDNYKVTESEFEKNEVLGAVLQRHDVPYTQIDKLVKKATAIFDVRKMRVGKPYTILVSEEGKAADYLIYEPNPFYYVVYDLRGETAVKIVERPIELKETENSGVVTASLWNAIVDNGMSYEIAAKMEAALAWQVDFHHIQKGDRFKLIYNEQYIDGEAVGVGNIQAAYFKNGHKEFNAYYYEDENYTGYFDDEGRPMKKAFLKSPVQYARISSAYNLRRFHPVLRRVKAHLGTDYAAPYGTPILAVASGTVSRAGRTRGNGNFVKIRHDKTYETQYLHMRKFAKGMKPGVHVNQGDVIGYVGSTGLATGPHVCFRFWKNGKQVDHRKQNLPPPNPMKGESLEVFKKMQIEMAKRLIAIEFPSEEDGVKSKMEKTVIDP
jgi:murein DD-endopeptidase MepM/ murein hydrolase activator NlpD